MTLRHSLITIYEGGYPAVIKAIHHAGLWVSDIDAILPFYQEVLGLEVLFDSGVMSAPFVEPLTGVSDAKVRTVVLHKDGQSWEFLQMVSPPGRSVPKDFPYAHVGRGHVCFEIEDIEAAYTRLEEEGIRFVCEPLAMPGIKMFYFEDPGGNRVEMVQTLG
jgi:catechol 2,3-dioxygenase-like lactoylglutathione lyase family enzyme